MHTITDDLGIWRLWIAGYLPAACRATPEMTRPSSPPLPRRFLLLPVVSRNWRPELIDPLDDILARLYTCSVSINCPAINCRGPISSSIPIRRIHSLRTYDLKRGRVMFARTRSLATVLCTLFAFATQNRIVYTRNAVVLARIERRAGRRTGTHEWQRRARARDN